MKLPKPLYPVAAVCLLSAVVAIRAQQPVTKHVPTSYVLGPDDQLFVDVVELPEVAAKTYRIDSDGTIALPFVGRTQAGGRTLRQFETEVSTLLKSQVREPHITAGLVETRSQPISIMGAVNTPGTQQLTQGKRLFDVVAAAGGLKQEAGDSIKISRISQEGKLNLPGEVEEANTGNYVAEVRVRDVVELQDAKSNIEVRPHDSISVAPASMVYVVGDVRKPGGLVLNRRPSISALEALSIAEGLSTTASPAKARILRPTAPGATERQDIPINLQQILSGKISDVQLRPDDVLYVPDNHMRKFIGRMADTALATASGIVIWRGL